MGGTAACSLGCFVCVPGCVAGRQANIKSDTTAVEVLLSKIRERGAVESADKLAKWDGKGACRPPP